MTEQDKMLYREGMISASEYEKRQKIMAENAETLFKMMSCFCFAEGCCEGNPCKQKACAASLSGMFYGAILTGLGATESWPCCLGTGITAIVLGALTATGLCVDDFGCLDSAERDSNPVEVPPGVIRDPPAVIHQPR